MNTTANLIDHIRESVTTATGITNTHFDSLNVIDTQQNDYPLFNVERLLTFKTPTLRTNSGVQRAYDLSLWFYVEDNGSDDEDAYTTLENYAFAALAEIEKSAAIVKMPSDDYTFQFYPYAGSDRLKALEVKVIYTMNVCVPL